MTKKTPPSPQPPRKFLFDIHNFDDPNAKDDVEEEPPPPTFSVEDLEAAKAHSYAEGRRDGNAEAQASFEKQVADTLGTVREHLHMLFGEEDRRARTFEKEAVQLAYTIFARAFPALHERGGLDEVLKTIDGVLETVRAQPELIIDVPTPYAEAVNTHIQGLLRNNAHPVCTVRGHDDMSLGTCRIAWVNGSAVRDGHHIAEEIRRKIEQVLADQAILPDNDVGDPNHGERNE